MELLSCYKSSTSQSDSSDKEFHPAKVKSIYLITYSQADLSIFSDRQLFADAFCDAVLNCKGPKSKVMQWTNVAKKTIIGEVNIITWSLN